MFQYLKNDEGAQGRRGTEMTLSNMSKDVIHVECRVCAAHGVGHWQFILEN